MTVEASIHPCHTRLERDLAHAIARMVPRLGARHLYELEDRLEDNVRDPRIRFGREGDSLCLYFNGRCFITFTKQG